MELMSLPRCGVRDKVGFGSDSRSKRYALQGSRWKVKALTYRISKYPKRLDRGEVDKEIAKAFSVWSEYTDLTFTQKRTAPVHIDIRFEENEHGDGDPFDGPGELLSLLKLNHRFLLLLFLIIFRWYPCSRLLPGLRRRRPFWRRWVLDYWKDSRN